MPASSVPLWPIAFSVYPDMYSTFMFGRISEMRCASSRPFIPGMMTSVSSR